MAESTPKELHSPNEVRLGHTTQLVRARVGPRAPAQRRRLGPDRVDALEAGRFDGEMRPVGLGADVLVLRESAPAKGIPDGHGSIGTLLVLYLLLDNSTT